MDKDKLANPAHCTASVFPLYVDMNVTLSLDDELVKKIRKIAVDRDTTLTAQHLQKT